MSKPDSYFRLWRDLVDADLHSQLPEVNDATQLVNSAKRYAIIKGSRWRPLLLISTYELSTGRDPSNVLHAASAIELIHCCTLMLDDLPFVDDAVTRRGQPACHLVFGQAVTVYASHLLFSLAERLAWENATALGIEQIPVWNQLITLRERLVEAQEIELNLSQGTLLPDENTLTRFYKLKCSPFVTAASLATTLGQVEVVVQNALTSFALYLGMAYQLADDIADVEGEGSAMGKSTGMDKDKVNFVSMLGVTQAKERAHMFIMHAQESLASLPFDTQLLADLMNRIVEPALGASAKPELQNVSS